MLSVNVSYAAPLVCLALGQLLSLSVTTEKCPARGIVYFCAKEGKYFLTCRSSKSLRHSGPCLSVLAGDRQNTQHRVEQDLKHSSAHYWSVFYIITQVMRLRKVRNITKYNYVLLWSQAIIALYITDFLRLLF